MEHPFHTRFLILCTARTGSNLLALFLKAHENIAMFGELFNLDALKEAQLRKALDNPTKYLNEYYNKVLSPETQAVGFKMFYDHLTPTYFTKFITADETAAALSSRIKRFFAIVESEYDQVELAARFDQTWEYLRREKGIKVIHLKRSNKLETLVSLKTAFLTDRWMVYGVDSPGKTVLSLTVDECENFFRTITDLELLYDEKFNGHPVLPVSYDELVGNTEYVLDQTFEFLGLRSKPLTTKLKKQISHPLNEVVSNYGRLKDNFSGTEWAHYFF